VNTGLDYLYGLSNYVRQNLSDYETVEKGYTHY
jgi:hypothetical protein